MYGGKKTNNRRDGMIALFATKLTICWEGTSKASLDICWLMYLECHSATVLAVR